MNYFIKIKERNLIHKHTGLLTYKPQHLCFKQPDCLKLGNKMMYYRRDYVFTRVIKGDAFMRRVWNIYEAVHKEGVVQVSVCVCGGRGVRMT